MAQRRQWSVLKKVEFSTLCVFGGWLLITLALWWTPLLAKHRAEAGFALAFYGAIYVLMGIVRKLPQFRFVPETLPPESAERLVRLRLLWTAELRLIFASGFAGTALTLPFSNTLRRVVAGLFLLALVASLVWFIVRWRMTLKAERHA